jgi:cytochrome c556
MKRLVCVVSVLALLAGMALVAGPAAAQKEPSIKEIMTKAHKGGNSIIASVGKELRGDEPDWEDIQSQSKELVKLGTSLGKNEPPQGDQESWEKLTKQYLTNAKALNEAAKKQDKSAALSAHKKLGDSCKNCHKVHKPS